MADRRPVVFRTTPFEQDLARLRDQHEEIESAVDEFCSALARGAMLAKPERLPGDPPSYVHRMDYPPYGARGRGRFIVIYAVQRGANPARDADVFYLLAIQIATSHLN